ncbi:MAG: acetyl-CoA carboxylase biotin carboxyl carrier protein [Proteobacteria bacterium]|nr:acetyl-CoA carboxylase biotin carboxyl carrier protein [Pseudomonadota bacterium]
MSKTPENKIDEDMVRQLTRLLEENGLTEIEYGRDGWHIRVVRGEAGSHRVSSGRTDDQTQASAAAGKTIDAAEEIDHSNAITSPMVGIVYTSPDADSPPFVKAGDEVTEGQTLLLIEAMKVFNPITAPKAGKVIRILVTNETPVEFGEPLIVLE